MCAPNCRPLDIRRRWFYISQGPPDSYRSDRIVPCPPHTAEHYVYILRCADDSYYTGYTTDPARRLAEHNAGDGAKYTRGRTPVVLVYLEGHDSKSAAMSREYELKQLRRSKKEQLVADSEEPQIPTHDPSNR